MDLVNTLMHETEKLDKAISRLSSTGRELAEYERDYKVKLRQEALKLRAEKGMPVTLIAKVIYGVPDVANLRLKRDIAETMHKTALEYINTLKLKIRILEAQVQREWGRNG